MRQRLGLTLAALLALGTAAGTAQADFRHGGHHRGMRDGGRLSAALDLTDEQKAAVKKLREEIAADAKPLVEQRREQKQEIRALLDAGNADATLLGRKMIAAHETGRRLAALHEEFADKFGALLTPEQKEKFDRLRAERQERRGRHRSFGAERGERDGE